MRRSMYVVAAVAAVTAVALTLGMVGTAYATAPSYTVSHTWGPYNGQVAPGATVPCSGVPNCAMTAPGGVPDFDEAPSVYCNQPSDALLGGTATINHKTTHGTTSKDVLNLSRIGAFWDSDGQRIGWASWFYSNGRPGWNTVTITVTCLVRR